MQIDGPSLQGTECLFMSVTSVVPEATAGANPELTDKLQIPTLKSSKITWWFSFSNNPQECRKAVYPWCWMAFSEVFSFLHDNLPD